MMGSDRAIEATSGVEEYGTVDSDRFPLAVAASHVLEDIPGHLAQAAALVFPAAQWPFPRLLIRRTTLHPVYVVDPSDEYLEWQRAQVGERAVYAVGSVAEGPPLPDSLQDLGLVLNPFGLQHRMAEVPLYASALRERCRGDAVLMTLDWGAVVYPENLTWLPGIAHEVRFSQESLLPAYGGETGWTLVKERTIRYSVKHAIQEMIEQLQPDQTELLRNATVQRDGVFDVQSSMIYRLYYAT